MRVIELRNYLLRDGATGEFIRYFEEHFLFSQRDEGMQVLGQFEVVGEPRRFVWIRGFESMAARLRGLSGFYGGPFWLAHRSRANAIGRVTTLTGGLGLEDRMAEPPGVVRADAGLVAVDFYRARPGRLDRVLGFFEQRLQLALVARGQEVLGHFVAELAPNDYPRLPVWQDADLLVVPSAYPDRERDACVGGRLAPAEEMRPLLAADVSTLLLRPTAKSLIRWHAA
jgi:hypothetical protein